MLLLQQEQCTNQCVPTQGQAAAAACVPRRPPCERVPASQRRRVPYPLHARLQQVRIHRGSHRTPPEAAMTTTATGALACSCVTPIPRGGRCPLSSPSLCAMLTAAILMRLSCAPAIRTSHLGTNGGTRYGGCSQSRWKTTALGTQQAGGGAVIWPAELGIRRRGECDGAGDGNRTNVTSGRLKFNKGIKRTT